MQAIEESRRENKIGFDAVTAAVYARKDHYFNGAHPACLPPTPMVEQPNGKPGPGFPDMTRCYLERRREMGPEKNMTHFLVFSERENKLLLAASSNMEQATFVVSENEDFTPHGENYTGFVSASFLGTHFSLYDHGVSQDEMPRGAFPKLDRREHCMTVYKSNILGRVPNSMRVVLGGLDGNESTDEGVLEARLNNPGSGPLTTLVTKPPRWNAELDAWTMDFKGRVKLASKKNFQLIDERDREWPGHPLLLLLRACSCVLVVLTHLPTTAGFARSRSGKGLDAVWQGDQESLYARLPPTHDGDQIACRGALHLCRQARGDVNGRGEGTNQAPISNSLILLQQQDQAGRTHERGIRLYA